MGITQRGTGHLGPIGYCHRESRCGISRKLETACWHNFPKTFNSLGQTARLRSFLKVFSANYLEPRLRNRMRGVRDGESRVQPLKLTLTPFRSA